MNISSVLDYLKTSSILFCVFFLFISCSTKKSVNTIDNLKISKNTPPGLLKISDNFYADRKEISNIDYIEYLYWNKKIFGSDSEEYSESLPDTTVWKNQIYYDSLILTYLRDEKYHSHPLVGINLNQAKNFSNWRTERVMELLLVENGNIEFLKNQNRANYFTIDRYLNGEYEGTKKQVTELFVPVYSIPTFEDWHKLAGINETNVYGIDSLSEKNQALEHSSTFLINTKQANEAQLGLLAEFKKHNLQIIPTRNYGYVNTHGLTNVLGNVSELIDGRSGSIGGDWNHQLLLDAKNRISEDPLPNSWTGFRNICRYKLIKKE